MEPFQKITQEANSFVAHNFNEINLQAFELVLKHEAIGVAEIVHQIEPELDPEEFCKKHLANEFGSYEAFLDALQEDDWVDVEINRNDPDQICDLIEESYDWSDQWETYSDEKQSEANETNYPIHGTIFEWRIYEPSEEWIENARKVGLGTMDAVGGFFEKSVFISSGGHSFEGSYWIPLYLLCKPDALQELNDFLKENPDVTPPAHWALHVTK